MQRGVGWVMQVTCLPTWSINSLTHCEASGGSNTKLPLINEATVPKNLIMFLCKHPKSRSFNYIKKPGISALTVTSMELIVSHFTEQLS